MTAERRTWVCAHWEYPESAEVVCCNECLAKALREAADEALRHMREEMPAPEGDCVCGHGAGDHCDPGCCGASCRFPVDDKHALLPACRCRHFRRAKGLAESGGVGGSVRAALRAARVPPCGYAEEGWEAFACTRPQGHDGEHFFIGNVTLRGGSSGEGGAA